MRFRNSSSIRQVKDQQKQVLNIESIKQNQIKSFKEEKYTAKYYSAEYSSEVGQAIEL